MLVLTGDAGIRSAQAIAATLRQAIADHDHIDIDTQTLTEADVTTVQTLLAAASAARAAGKTLALLAPLGGPLDAVLHAAGFLAPDQEHAGFWRAAIDQPAAVRPGASL